MKHLFLPLTILMTASACTAAANGEHNRTRQLSGSVGDVYDTAIGLEVKAISSAQGFSVGQLIFPSQNVKIDEIREIRTGSGDELSHSFFVAGVDIGSGSDLQTLIEVGQQFHEPSKELVDLLIKNAGALHTEYDAVSNTRTLSVNRYSSDAPLALVIVRDSAGTRARLRFHLWRRNWLFFDKAIVRVGPHEYLKHTENVDRDVVSRGVEETAWIDIEQGELDLIEALIGSDEATVRFLRDGDEDNDDQLLDDGHIDDLRTTLVLFKNLDKQTYSSELMYQLALIALKPPLVGVFGDEKNANLKAWESTQKGRSAYLPVADVNASYPRRAAERGIEGYAIVEFKVDAGGSVDPYSVTLVDAEPSGYFENNAIKAAKRLQYPPHDLPELRTRYKFVFDLKR